MTTKRNNLTLRQAQALASISNRRQNFGIVRLSDLIEDLGVAFATLADHLDALKKAGYITTVRDKPPRNLDFMDEVNLTSKGQRQVRRVLADVQASNNGNTVYSILQSLKETYQPPIQTKLFTGSMSASFAKAFEKLVQRNETEPVLTTIAMYTDLDGQLSLLKRRDRDKYVTLSRAKLNLEIRNGRLASIAIPTTIRGKTRVSDLERMLGGSWSWMGSVSSTSLHRYWQEARSLGLLQVQGDYLASTKPITSDTISWLAKKTNFTFSNTIHASPKSALVLFRESFFMPYTEDLFDPENARQPLEWLQFIRENMADRSEYLSCIQDAFTILKEHTGLLQEVGGRVVPTTILRKAKTDKDLDTSFRTILKQKDRITAQILIAVTMRPAISMIELWQDLNKRTSKKMSMEELENTVTILANKNLIHIATSRSPLGDSTKLFSFIHLPYLTSEVGGRDTNAVLRSLKPYLLQQVNELFNTDEERKAIASIFKRLMETHDVDLEQVASEFSRTVSNKLLSFANNLDPFISMRKDYSGFSLNAKNAGLSQVVLDSLAYTAITSYDSLGLYSQAIANLVEKDKDWLVEIESESTEIRDDLIEKGMKSGFGASTAP